MLEEGKCAVRRPPPPPPGLRETGRGLGLLRVVSASTWRGPGARALPSALSENTVGGRAYALSPGERAPVFTHGFWVLVSGVGASVCTICLTDLTTFQLA